MYISCISKYIVNSYNFHNCIYLFPSDIRLRINKIIYYFIIDLITISIPIKKWKVL